MKITWLGQVGLLIETGSFKIMTDPYLLDTLYEKGSLRCRRETAPELRYLSEKPDAILLTHVHGDHYDGPSLTALLKDNENAVVLANTDSWKKIRTEIGGTANYVEMQPGTEWTFPEAGVHVRAVKAVHSDYTAVGYLIHAEGITLYVSGDTLYSEAVIREVGEPVDLLYVVMNGVGNNMNYADAARFAEKVGAKLSVPVHWGLFKALSHDPADFVKEAARRGMKSYVQQIYETVDTEKILK